jgi:DNA-binding response OmpR family regulator
MSQSAQCVHRLLVVDDDPEIRDLLKKFFELVGYSVDVAEDGKSASRMLDAGAYDLMVTDIVMPNQDGVENIMQARKAYPGMRLIAMSGGGYIQTKTYLKVAESLGADAVFQKPFKTQEMLAKVRELLPPAG